MDDACAVGLIASGQERLSRSSSFSSTRNEGFPQFRLASEVRPETCNGRALRDGESVLIPNQVPCTSASGFASAAYGFIYASPSFSFSFPAVLLHSFRSETESQQSASYFQYIGEACEKGVVLVECKGVFASLLYELNTSEPYNRTALDFTPDPVTTNDAQDTPSPNGSLGPHSHFVFSFAKPLRPREGLVFGAGFDEMGTRVDFRFPGREQSYPTMSRQCFRLYINDLGSWMFSNLSRSEYIVNEDTICSKYCKHNQESLISVALHPERANLIRVSGIEVSVRVPTGSCKNGPGPWVLRERLRLFPDTSSQSTGSSTTQALMGRRSMPLSSTPKLRNTYHELQASAVQGRFYMIKTLVDKKTGSRLLGKIDNNANDDVLTREENLSKTLKSLLRICTVLENPVSPDA